MSVWENISALMQRDGLSGRKLAEIAGVAPSAVSKWKAGGAIRSTNLEALAVHFGVSVDWLLDRESLSPPSKSKVAEDGYLYPAGQVTRNPNRLDIDPRACRFPERCDLEARLAAIEEEAKGTRGQLDEIRRLLISLLAEERSKDVDDDAGRKVG